MKEIPRWMHAILSKAFYFVIGVFYVPIMIYIRKKEHGPWQRHDKTRPFTYWELAWRNPVDGMAFLHPHPTTFVQEDSHAGTFRVNYNHDWKPMGTEKLGLAFPEPWTLRELKLKSGWRWRRYRRYSSYRYVRLRKGGTHYSEIYFGWKLGSKPPVMDFASSIRGWLFPRKVGT